MAAMQVPFLDFRAQEFHTLILDPKCQWEQIGLQARTLKGCLRYWVAANGKWSKLI